MKKAIVFDSSTLISLAMNGLFEEIKLLKKFFNGYFLITQEVYYEIVQRPIKVKRFELEALRLKKLIDERILEFPEVVGIDSKKISSETNSLLKKLNSSFIAGDRPVHIVDSGEVASLVLYSALEKKGFDVVLAIDERTTRVLCEKPRNLVKILEKKLHSNVRMVDEEPIKCKVIRSAELVYILWKKNLLNIKDSRTLDALLWAVKFRGCAISSDEIREIERIS